MQTFIFLAIVGVSFGILYMRWVRPWQLTWGASEEEILLARPGDEIVERPTFNATRGVTINAPPEMIYPWIVQMGVNRAGWYSYDVMDNLGRRSAEKILPEQQDMQVGDLIPLSPDGKHGMVVNDFRSNKWILWWDNEGRSTWLWSLDRMDEERTRLITRVRVDYAWLSPAILFHLLIEFTDIVMMRKCMLGIKRRAEGLADQRRQGILGVPGQNELQSQIAYSSSLFASEE